MGKSQKPPQNPLSPIESDRGVFLQTEFAKETDRGAALLGCAAIEESMKRCIEFRLVDSQNLQRDIFGSVSPLGSGKAKRLVLEGMGLISANTSAEIERIARIRNKFAHWVQDDDIDEHGEIQAMKFESTAVRKIVDELTTPALPWVKRPLVFDQVVKSETLQSPPESFKIPTTAREKYIFTVIYLSVVLMGVEKLAKRPETEATLRLPEETAVIACRLLQKHYG